MEIKALLLDVGGVLLSNGWDRALREEICSRYRIDYDRFKPLHEQFFDAFEKGEMSFDSYLERTIFCEKRSFTPEEFKKTIYESVKSYPEMVHLIGKLREESALVVALLSNEGRELALDRISRFHLDEIADLFLFSSFVHLRKPDTRIYRLAGDILHLEPAQMLYIDDRENLVAAASSLGIPSHRHTDPQTTQNWLYEKLGFALK